MTLSRPFGSEDYVVLIFQSLIISPNYYTKLERFFKKKILKEFQDNVKEFLKKLKILPTRVGFVCGKMSNKKA